ncbi:PKD domain-containing protein [Salinarchaeum laminariae]|uniref:PKD domain-containing protein n=1 Tax=Salinarchaeum laminariae TaxID=869888 RepID=UPI0020BEA6B4|nr:PKD domain-containing protein [Salinarchaeum laminariae]
MGADSYIYYFADDVDDAGSYDINNPPTIHPGETVDINVYLENTGGTAGEYSAMQMQFPSLTESGDDSQFTVSASGFPENMHTIGPGDTVYDQTDPPKDATSWQYELTRDLVNPGGQLGFTAEVTPEEPGEFRVLVRGTLSDDTSQTTHTDFITTDGSVLDPDQKDYVMKEIVFDVQPKNEAPIADAGGPYEVDEGDTVSLDSSGSSDPDGTIDGTSWTVTSGPGSVSGDTYHAPDSIDNDDTATVELEVTDNDGSQDTDPATIKINHVNEPPNADAGGPYSVDEGGSVFLDSDGSSDPDGSIDQTTWTVDGQGSISNGVYQAPDDITEDATATVELEVTDDDGEPDTDTATVDITAVNEPPNADAGGPYSVDEGSSISLDSSGSSDPDGSISSTTWSVLSGPGSISGGTYQVSNSAGDTTATVKLKVTDNEGEPATDTATVDIQPVNEPPNADAGGPYSVGDGSSVSLDASGSFDPDGTIDDMSWSIVSGGGSISGGTYHAPDSVDGDTTTTVELEVTDDQGETDTDQATVDIQYSNEAPSADAGGPYDVQEDGSVTLDSSGSSDPDGSIDGASWTIASGPGYISGGTYHAPDSMTSDATVTVDLTVTDDDGTPDSDTTTIDVSEVNDPPTADAGGPYSVDEGSSVALDASGSTDGDGSIQTVTWEVIDGPGSVTDGTYYAPDDAGDETVTVRVTVTDDDGDPDTATATVNVYPPNAGDPPIANLTYAPKQPTVGEWVQFNASGSTAPDGSIESYEWKIDGNSTGTATNPLIGANFSAPGTYDVTLIVTDDAGVNDTASTSVEVVEAPSDAPPTANVSYGPETPNVTEQVTFDASGSFAPDGTIQSYEWDLNGNGTAGATGESVTATFTDAGTQEITLEVTDDNGNTDSTTVAVHVIDPTQNGTPVANVIAVKNSTAGETLTLDASDSYHTGDSPIEYEWTQTAGPTVTLSAIDTTTPTFTAPTVDEERSVEFELTVTDPLGNTSTTDVAVTVSPSDQGDDGSDGDGAAGGGGGGGYGGYGASQETDVHVTVDDTSSSTVAPGETVTIDTTFENIGDGAAEQSIMFFVDGELEDMTVLELSAGETVDKSFAYEVSSSNAGTLNATVQSADDTASIDVTVNSDEADSDGGPDSGDGEESDPDENQSSTEDDDESDSSADSDDESSAGSDDASDSGSETEDADTDSLPGFGSMVALLALAAITLGAVMRDR